MALAHKLLRVIYALLKQSRLNKEQKVKVIERVIVREVGEESPEASNIDKHGDLHM
jgi:hypothetical protein